MPLPTARNAQGRPLTSQTIAANDAEGAEGGVRIRYYHCDQIGTPRELTRPTGEITWQATYKAWGNTQTVQWEVAQGAAQEQTTFDVEHDKVDRSGQQPLRFQGQYFDEETGLHYNRFRYYDPDSGRFISHDPIGLLGDDNTFVYTSNPTMWVDPLGLWKGQPRNNGRFGHGKDPNKPTKPQSTGHGNSNDNPNCTTLYKLVNPDGTVSKWGITSEANPFDRYSTPELGLRKMIPVATGSRMDMKALERVLVQRFGGKENNEPWANTIKNSGSPEQTIAAFKAAYRGCIKLK